MNQDLHLGTLNGHAVGRILKEGVGRAMAAIQAQRFAFEATAKQGYSGNMDDVCTSADKRAQEIYLRMLTECFPDCGVVAEEDHLRIEPKNGCTAYFTVDPLDGTKAYVRRQSHGVGTMIALVDKGKVLAAYIGDINTGEIYGYRPGSMHVHRINKPDAFEELTYREPFAPGKSYMILRDPLETAYSKLSSDSAKAFKSYLVDGGSIGVWLARLWKREVAAAILPPSMETPWDSTPIVGISLTLGYRFYRPSRSGDAWVLYTPELMPTIYKRDHETLIVHEKDLPCIEEDLPAWDVSH